MNMRALFPHGRLAIPALVVIALSVLPAPVAAGGGEIKINPKLLKLLKNKPQLSGSIKAQLIKFKFNVPVNVQKAHHDLEKIVVNCMVADKDFPWLFAKNYGTGGTVIPLTDGAYDGTVQVVITTMDEGDPAAVSYWGCVLGFIAKNGDVLPVFMGLNNPSSLGAFGPAPNTTFTPIVHGELFP